MTVKELIETLKKYPTDTKVEVYSTGDFEGDFSHGGELNEVFFEDGAVGLWHDGFQ